MGGCAPPGPALAEGQAKARNCRVILVPATSGGLTRSTLVHEAGISYHLGIKDLPIAIRPRERLHALGASALADDELLAILMRTGTQRASALELARSVLSAAGGLTSLGRASAAELSQACGIGPAKAAEIKAAFELGKRLLTLVPEERFQITGPREVYTLLRGEMSFLEQESVRVVLLNTKNRVLGVPQATLGSLKNSPVRIGELFRDAVRQQAAAIVLVHNHPSGDPTPSSDDVALTRKVVEAGRLLDIEVLDHVVIGQPGPDRVGWASLRELGLGFDTV